VSWLDTRVIKIISTLQKHLTQSPSVERGSDNVGHKELSKNEPWGFISRVWVRVPGENVILGMEF